MDIKNSAKSIFIGGARSGKSLLAEKFIAADDSTCCYLATAPLSWINSDPNFALRVEKHVERRQGRWRLEELSHPDDLYHFVESAKEPLLIDSVGTWIAGAPGFEPDLLRLKSAIYACSVPLAFVSEEVGLAPHPLEDVAREFVDTLGVLNQAIASWVGRAFFVVAGLAVELRDPDLSWPQK